jgi:hypothetical protein
MRGLATFTATLVVTACVIWVAFLQGMAAAPLIGEPTASARLASSAQAPATR